VFKGIVSYFDEQTSRAVLGQVLASDARATGLGTAIAELHRDVRQDIRESDGGACRSSVEYLVRLWTQFNKGPNAPRLLVRPDIRAPEDLEKFTKAVLPWFVQGGLKVGKEWLYDKLNVPVPRSDEEVVEAPLAPGATAPGAPTPGMKSVSKKQRVRQGE
jgi:phage gp29-like protein